MGSARLVDEDGVDLVDDRVVQGSLGALRQVARHVVAQVVECQLGVGRISDIGAVRLLLAHRPEVLESGIRMGLVKVLGVVHEGGRGSHVDANRQPQEVIDRRHPSSVAAGEVIVDGHQVDALPGQRVQVEGQARHERLAFTGLHLGDLALVEDDASHQLDVEVAETYRAPRGLAADGECLYQQLVEVMPLVGLLAQSVGACAEAGVVQLLELRLQR